MTIRAVAIVILLHAVAGLGLSALSVATVSGTQSRSFSELSDPERLCKAVERRMSMSEAECQQLVSKFDGPRMREIMSSGWFRFFYWSFVSFGVIFNVCLVVAGLRLLRGGNPGGVGLLIVLMLVFAAHTRVLPASLTEDEEWALPFGAAWGIGNMGTSLMLVTRVWIWGPIAVVLATRPWRHRDAV